MEINSVLLAQSRISENNTSNKLGCLFSNFHTTGITLGAYMKMCM